MSPSIRSFVCYLLVLLCSSCGYRAGDSSSPVFCYHTVTIPYVQGDCDGRFTASLIREVSASGLWEYRDRGGALVLSAQLCRFDEENIGYEFDTNDEGEQTKLLLPNEGRLYCTIRFCLKEGCSGRTVLGPSCVSTWIDYDFNPLSTNDDLTQLSLGQFVQIDEAQEVARDPLYDRLARKVVDFLACAW